MGLHSRFLSLSLPQIPVSRLPTALGPSNSKSKSYSYLQLYLYSYVGDLFTTVIICKKCHYNLEKISGLCNKLSFTHSPKQYKIPSSVYILKCLEGSLFLTFYTYLFCHISGRRRRKKWKNMKCLFFDWDFSYTYIYISVTELWNWLCFAKRAGGSICLWLGQKLFCWLQFFSLFFFLPGVFTKMICKQIGYENSIELWDFLC